MYRKQRDFENLRLIYLSKTRIANPSEWEGQTDDNKKLFARFTAGELSVGTGETFADAKRNLQPVIDLNDDETDYLGNDEIMKLMRWKKVIIEPKYSQDEYDS